MGRKYRRLLEEEDVQQRHLRIAEREHSDSAAHETSDAPPHGILSLQRSIGNQAVQRLIQRDPKPKAQSADEQPSAVATITGAQRGKFKGTSRAVGHEGKIEILGLQFKPTDSKMTVILFKRVDESSSPAFMMAYQTGERITTAQFMSIRHDENGNVETVMTYDFSDGYVTGVQMSSSQGIPYEAITLEFDLKKDKERE